MFRVVMLKKLGDVETRYGERLDLEQTEETLHRDTVVGLFIGKKARAPAPLVRRTQ
jgi:hypothetical protein